MLLQIGADESRIYAHDAGDARPLAVLAIGSRKTAQAFFRHDPPQPGEIENAIQTVEDAIMAAGIRADVRETLDVDPPIVATIAALDGAGGATAGRAVGLDAIERVFGRLAAIALGRPAAQDAVPTDPAFAATLTILREFMHHGGFVSIAAAPVSSATTPSAPSSSRE